MEPFNFSTVLERNLSASWYRDIPTIKVDANFDTLKVRLCQLHPVPFISCVYVGPFILCVTPHTPEAPIIMQPWS